MKNGILRKIPLKNGLILECIDKSRKVAGDRYCLDVVFRIEFRMDRIEACLPHVDQKTLSEIQSVIGETVVFEKSLSRNFVDEKNMDRIKTEIVESYISSVLEYLSQQTFPERFLRKTHQEILEKRRIDNLIKKGANDGG
jgi:hypothetical protein